MYQRNIDPEKFLKTTKNKEFITKLKEKYVGGNFIQPAYLPEIAVSKVKKLCSY